MRVYKKISVNLKKDIRKRYEYGESLKELAYEYCVNYGSLKNTASKEEWIKGKNSQILYDEEIRREREEYCEEIKEIKKHYKNLHKANLASLMKLEKDKEEPINKSKEEARKNRVLTIKESYLLAKELYGIMTPSEEAEYQLRLTKLQHARESLEERDVVDIDDEGHEVLI